MVTPPKARTGTRFMRTLVDPMKILSQESRMILKGVAGRMNSDHYGSPTQRIVVLCDSLASFGESRLSKMTPQDVWENTKSYVHEDGSRRNCRFDTYPRSDTRYEQYPPVGICNCGVVQVARVRQRNTHLIGQYAVIVSGNGIKKVIFRCSSCIKSEVHRANLTNKSPTRYYSYEKALRLASDEKKPKRGRKIARKSRVIAHKLTRRAKHFFKS